MELKSKTSIWISILIVQGIACQETDIEDLCATPPQDVKDESKIFQQTVNQMFNHLTKKFDGGKTEKIFFNRQNVGVSEQTLYSQIYNGDITIGDIEVQGLNGSVTFSNISIPNGFAIQLDSVTCEFHKFIKIEIPPFQSQLKFQGNILVTRNSTIYDSGYFTLTLRGLTYKIFNASNITVDFESLKTDLKINQYDEAIVKNATDEFVRKIKLSYSKSIIDAINSTRSPLLNDMYDICMSPKPHIPYYITHNNTAGVEYDQVPIDKVVILGMSNFKSLTFTPTGAVFTPILQLKIHKVEGYVNFTKQIDVNASIALKFKVKEIDLLATLAAGRTSLFTSFTITWCPQSDGKLGNIAGDICDPRHLNYIVNTLTFFVVQCERVVAFDDLPAEISEEQFNRVISREHGYRVILESFRIPAYYGGKKSNGNGFCEFHKKFEFDIPLRNEITVKGTIRISNGISEEMVKFETTYSGAKIHLRGNSGNNLPQQTITHQGIDIKVSPKNSKAAIVEEILRKSTVLLSQIETQFSKILVDYASPFGFMISQCFHKTPDFSGNYFIRHRNTAEKYETFGYGLVDYRSLKMNINSEKCNLMLTTNPLKLKARWYHGSNETIKVKNAQCEELNVDLSGSTKISNPCKAEHDSGTFASLSTAAEDVFTEIRNHLDNRGRSDVVVDDDLRLYKKIKN